MSGDLAARLVDLVGAANVIDDAAERAYYAHDIAGPAPHAPELVVRPPSVDATVTCVAAITDAGHALTVRGGGHSYSGGYGPTRPGTVILDMSALDRVVEINEADGWVTAEAGCTWRTLYDTLAAVGRRTPFFGPLSGIVATVGGAASQNAAFFGSARHGPMSASVLGLDVVTADGTLMRLGSVGDKGFARDFGPDPVGLFLGDSGAFGVKVRITMELVPVPAAVRFASFSFESFKAVIDAQIALVGVDAIAESYGFDAETHENLRRAGFSIGEGAAALRDVAQAEGGSVSGIAAAVRAAAGVRRAVGETRNSLHLVIEGASEAAAIEAADAIAACAGRHGGTEIPDTIPRITRSRPFRPLKSLLGPEGEAWLPMHGLLPLSRARAGLQAAEDCLAAHGDEMRALGIRVARLTTMVGDRLLLEPQFFWPDALSPFHLRAVTDAQRAHFGDRAPNEAVRARVHALRASLVEALAAHGATHYQIGTYYPYLERIDPGQRALIESVKKALDPKNLMSPGALGL